MARLLTAARPFARDTEPVTDPRVAAILVAAGAGTRLGHERPKAFVTVGDRTLLEHAVSRFRGPAGPLVVVVPAADLATAAELVPGAHVVAGGDTRQRSVACGLAALGDLLTADSFDVVLVHDVARPFVSTQVIGRVVAAVRAGAEAVVPVVAVADTLRTVDGTLIDRAVVRAVQTPQGFTPDALRAAHARRDAAATDDATLAEAAGYRVVTVEGSADGFKITEPFDLLLAQVLAQRPGDD